jgi:hypothetical protein
LWQTDPIPKFPMQLPQYFETLYMHMRVLCAYMCESERVCVTIKYVGYGCTHSLLIIKITTFAQIYVGIYNFPVY